MPSNKDRNSRILEKAGLKEIMVWKEPEPYVFSNRDFDQYMSEKYRNSSLRETDEVYRISETVVIHRASGLRVEYVETESFFGDVLTYKLKDIFIITKEGVRLQVMDMNLARGLFKTPVGEISFYSVKKTSSGD